MIKDGKPLLYNPDISIIGFNVEFGDIVSEKLYHEKNYFSYEQHSPCKVVNEFMQKKEMVELFSVENASANEGIIKYDFKIIDKKDCEKIIDFFELRSSFFLKEYISVFSHSTIMENAFYVVGIRTNHNAIEDLEFYYRRKPNSISRIDPAFLGLLSEDAIYKLEKMSALILQYSAWLKLAAIDYQKEKILLKFYYETNQPIMFDAIIEKEKDSHMQKSLSLIKDFAKKSKLRFIGMAIVIELKSERERFNYYFEWDE